MTMDRSQDEMRYKEVLNQDPPALGWGRWPPRGTTGWECSRLPVGVMAQEEWVAHHDEQSLGPGHSHIEPLQGRSGGVTGGKGP